MIDQERVYNDFKNKLGQSVQCVHLPKSGGVCFSYMRHMFNCMLLFKAFGIIFSTFIITNNTREIFSQYNLLKTSRQLMILKGWKKNIQYLSNLQYLKMDFDLLVLRYICEIKMHIC